MWAKTEAAGAYCLEQTPVKREGKVPQRTLLGHMTKLDYKQQFNESIVSTLHRLELRTALLCKNISVLNSSGRTYVETEREKNMQRIKVNTNNRRIQIKEIQVFLV